MGYRYQKRNHQAPVSKHEEQKHEEPESREPESEQGIAQRHLERLKKQNWYISQPPIEEVYSPETKVQDEHKVIETAPERLLHRQQSHGHTTPTSKSAPVVVSNEQTHRDVKHLETLYDIKLRRRQCLELKNARFGYAVDVSVPMEMEDLTAELEQLKQQIHYTQLRLDLQEKLNENKQRELFAIISGIVGVPIDNIKMINIITGSVIAIMEMPLPNAANLVALHRQGYPQLNERGIAHVWVDEELTGQPEQVLLKKAVQFEESLLKSRKSDEEFTKLAEQQKRYISSTVPITLRVKLTDDFIKN